MNLFFFLMLGVGAVLVVFQAGWIVFSMDSGYIRPWQCCCFAYF